MKTLIALTIALASVAGAQQPTTIDAGGYAYAGTLTIGMTGSYDPNCCRSTYVEIHTSNPFTWAFRVHLLDSNNHELTVPLVVGRVYQTSSDSGFWTVASFRGVDGGTVDHITVDEANGSATVNTR